MKNILAVSVIIDDIHKAIIYPSGTKAYINIEPTAEGDLYLYKSNVVLNYQVELKTRHGSISIKYLILKTF